MAKDKDVVVGIENIRLLLGVSESSAMGLIQFENFPAKKNADGVYEVTRKDWKEWEAVRVPPKPAAPLKPEPQPDNPQPRKKHKEHKAKK